MTSYERVARFYDGVYQVVQTEDVPFYTDLARGSGGPVLEIACGTGRILLPTARAGIEVDGLDNSRAMLEVLQVKLAKEDPAVQARVSVHEGDMRSFDLGKTFPLVTMPFRPFQHMLTEEDQVAALTAARKHLAPDGRLVMNVFYPRWDLLAEGLGVEKKEAEWPDPDDPAQRIERWFVREAVHRNAQYFEGQFIYRVFRGDEQVEEQTAPLVMSYFVYPQMRLLFRVAGLAVVEEYGSFDKAPIDDGGEMIFVLKRA